VSEKKAAWISDKLRLQPNRAVKQVTKKVVRCAKCVCRCRVCLRNRMLKAKKLPRCRSPSG
jgi:hypothetical protein